MENKEIENEFAKEFNSVAECLNYLADECYLCAGDSIKFYNPNPYEDDVVTEIHTFGMCNNLLSKYKINNK